MFASYKWLYIKNSADVSFRGDLSISRKGKLSHKIKYMKRTYHWSLPRTVFHHSVFFLFIIVCCICFKCILPSLFALLCNTFALLVNIILLGPDTCSFFGTNLSNQYQIKKNMAAIQSWKIFLFSVLIYKKGTRVYQIIKKNSSWGVPSLKKENKKNQVKINHVIIDKLHNVHDV